MRPVGSGSPNGPVAVPFDRPHFVFGGIFRAGDSNGTETRPTASVVPLGVPHETTISREEERREENERVATAAFKVRLALPGSLGESLSARVESLRALPEERLLAQPHLGTAVAPPGGAEWPDGGVFVTLRRVVDGSVADAPLERGYELYESDETVLVIADPRAARGYRRQDIPNGADPATTTADEKAQCRRCEWPSFLPDPEGNDPALGSVRELLAGRFVRAVLAEDVSAPEALRQRTRNAIAWFESRGGNYPPPIGYLRVAAPADAVPSPIQVSMVAPSLNAATWPASEAGVRASLLVAGHEDAPTSVASQS